VDTDAFVAAHQAEWDRLDRLVRRRRHLSGEEVDELVAAYQRTATHLSELRTAGHDPGRSWSAGGSSGRRPCRPACCRRAQAARLVNHQFRGYYSQYAATSFAAKVWTNNAWVAAESLTFGILLGVPTLLVLLGNAADIGVDGGLMIAHSKGTLFFALVLPHGMLELSAVFLAAAAGLRLGWTIIDPGRRPAELPRQSRDVERAGSS
jgi:hypothetical protein